jgi:hypothetical protein
MIYLLILTNIFSIFSLAWLLKKYFVLLDQFDSLNEKMDECLETVEFSHNRLSKLLKNNMLFDDPVAVEMVQNVKNARDSLRIVANKIVSTDEEE